LHSSGRREFSFRKSSLGHEEEEATIDILKESFIIRGRFDNLVLIQIVMKYGRRVVP